MNFDTRTIIDIISINENLKEKIIEIISEEKIFIKNLDVFDSDRLIDSVYPSIKHEIKLSLKKDLKSMGLSILRGVININSIDCKTIIDILSKK